MIDMEKQISRLVPIGFGEFKAGGKLVLLQPDALVSFFKGNVQHLRLIGYRFFVQTYAYNHHIVDLFFGGFPFFSEHIPHPCRKSARSEEHTSELQSRQYLVCRLLLEKKNI